MDIPENLFICGFFDPSHRGNLGNYGAPEKPPRLEVEICKLWIEEFIDVRKTINGERSSYALKHYVEEWADYYIPNGAFIQAAIELGFNFESSGPNAWFNMSFTRARKANRVPGRSNNWAFPKPGSGKNDPRLKALLDS
jgi:hypothetical protein